MIRKLALILVTLLALLGTPTDDPAELALDSMSLTASAAGAGCDSLRPQDVRTIADHALNAKQLACIFFEKADIIDERQLARICNISDALLNLVADLVGQREGAKRSGIGWGARPQQKDAGVVP